MRSDYRVAEGIQKDPRGRKSMFRNPNEFDPENPTPGLYCGLNYTLYHNAQGVNWSTLRFVGQNLGKYRFFRDHPEELPDSDDLSFGRCFHTAVNEPMRFADEYVIQPPTYETEVTKGRKPNKTVEIIEKPWSNNANICRDWIKEQRAKGKQVVTASARKKALAMAASIRNLPDARAIMEGGYPEVSIFWIDPQTEVLCKGRLDWFKEWRVGDVKKVARMGGAQWEKFAKHVQVYSLHCQAAMYMDGLSILRDLAGEPAPEVPLFTWLVVEDQKPHDAAIYDLYDHPESYSRPWLQAGRKIWHSHLQEVAHAMKVDEWPPYNPGADGITEAYELVPPDWVRLDTE